MLFSFLHRFRAHVWQSAANYSQQFGGLILGVILARILDPKSFGEFAYASSIILLAQIPVTWSLSQKLLASRFQNPKLIEDSWILANWVCLGKSVVTIGVVLWQYQTRGFEAALLTALVGIPACFFEYLSLLRVENEAVGNFKANFLASISSVSTIALVAIPSGLLGFGAYSLALPAIVSAPILFLVYFYSSTMKYRRKLAFATIERKSILDGGMLWLASNSEQALVKLDKVVLGTFSTATQLGYYNRAFNYSPVSHMAMSSLYTNATIAALSDNRSLKNKLALTAKIAVVLILGGFINWLILFFFSHQIVTVVFGPQWIGAVPTFQALGPLSLCFAAFYLPAAFLISQKAFISLSFSRVTGVILFVSGALFFQHELNSALVASLLCISLLVSGFLSFISFIAHILFFREKQ